MYGGTKSEMERLLADATKLTGVEYNIDNLSDVYDAIHAVQQELGITGTTALEATETFSGSMAAMKASFSNVLGGLSLGQDIKPALNALAQTTSTFLFGNFIPMVGNILKGLPGAIVTFMQAAAPQMLSAGVQLINQISSGITTGIPTFITSLQSIINGIFSWITTNLPQIMETGVQILTSIATGIFQALPQLITVASELLNTFITFLMVNIPVILEAGKNLLLNLVDGIIANLPAVGASAIQAISSFIDTIIANYPQYIQTGWEILQSLAQGILDRLPELITTAVTLIGQFVNMIISKIPDVVSSGIQVLLGLVTGILNSIPNLTGALGTIASTIKTSISNIDLFGAGKAIIDGFLNGLNASYENVKSFVGGIGNWIKENKGPIEYDRKLLIPAGNAIMGGLDESLQDKFKDVKRTVSGMAGQLQAGFNVNANELELLNQRIEREMYANIQSNASFSTNHSSLESRLESLIAEVKELASRPVLVQAMVDGKSFNKENAPYQTAVSAKRNQHSMRGLATDARI